jgi:hypothetical protein
MKNWMPLAVGTATLCLALSANVRAEELQPGQVDFGTFSPGKEGGEFVEVNVPSGLISLAATFVEKQEPDVAKLLNGLKMVHVNVIGLSEENRAEIQKRAQKVRKDLTAKGWERIVVAQQNEKEAGVYLKMSDKGAVQGLVAVVMDGDQHAVFVNIVGEIRPDQIALLGEKLNLDPLKKLGPGMSKSKKKEVESEEK